MRTCEWEQGGLKRIIDVCCSKQLLPSTKNAAFVYVPTYLPTFLCRAIAIKALGHTNERFSEVENALQLSTYLHGWKYFSRRTVNKKMITLTYFYKGDFTVVLTSSSTKQVKLLVILSSKSTESK